MKPSLVRACLVAGVVIVLGVAFYPRELFMDTSVPDGPIGPYHLNPAQLRDVQASVKDVLVNPASAVFGRYEARRRGSGDVVVCGYVSARNSDATPSVEQPYYVPLMKHGKVLSAQMDTNRNIIPMMCAREAIWSIK